MLRLFSFICIVILSGCTMSISLANTRGTADDVIDSTPTTSTEADGQLTIPASLVGV
jgi:hypothetical protein